MTIERAIEILNPEHREKYESIEPVNEACRMGMKALKENEKLRKEMQQIKNKIASMLAKYFDCPCNFSPLDEEMIEYCQYYCDMDNNVTCWERVIEKTLNGE